MIARRTSTDKLVLEMRCYTCYNTARDFILLSPPEWIDPKHEEIVCICIPCAKSIGGKANSTNPDSKPGDKTA